MAVSRVDAAGALSVGAYGLLLALSRGGQDPPIGAFLGIMFAAWALLGLACTGSPAVRVGKIWLWAIAFRLVGFFGQPVLEDDWYRYLWDGAVFAWSGNPYGKPPTMFFSDPQVPQKLQAILDGINHPDVPTIYGPVCQALFLISYWIAPGELWPLKLMLIAADLATIVLMGRLVRGRCLLLYAWCPLLIKEIAFTAHPDILGIAFLIAALVIKRPRSVAMLCALAFGTKVIAAVIAGLLLVRLPKKYWLAFGAVLAGLYFPFWVQGSLADWSGVKEFASSWEFNSTIYGVLSIWMGDAAAKVLCAGLFLIVCGAYAAKWNGGVPRGDLLYGLFFLLSAVVNPWYLLWMLPFVALYPSAAGIAAIVVIVLAYVHGLNLPGTDLGPYDHPTWVRVVEVVTIFVAGSLQFLLRGPTRQIRE